MAKRMTPEDEAKFALLEPDGASPLKARRAAMQRAAISQRKGCLVLAFSLIFMLYLAYPRPTSSAPAHSGGAFH